MINDLVNDLKRDEGFVPHAYQDHLGYWTLGYGFLIDERRDADMPKRIAEQWLIHEVVTRWNKLVVREPWLNTQPEDVRRALGNMAYQLGLNGVCNFKKMLKALKNGNRELAAAEALNSRWAEQTPRRARRVATLIRGR